MNLLNIKLGKIKSIQTRSIIPETSKGKTFSLIYGKGLHAILEMLLPFRL
ncbi:MAG: hypothetical protein QW274_11350 [Saccharolobus sp.]